MFDFVLYGKKTLHPQPSRLYLADLTATEVCDWFISFSTGTPPPPPTHLSLFPMIILLVSPQSDCLNGLVVKASVWILFATGFFLCWVIQVTQKCALQWPPCQAPGIIGSALGLISPVSVYFDWVRNVATSISVWQHVKLSSTLRPWDTQACCWDEKQS